MDMCLLSRQPLLVLLRVALAVLAECALLYDLGSADAPTPPASAEGEGAAATEDAFARAARSHRTGGTVDAFESAVKALKDSPALWETHRTRAVLAAAVRVKESATIVRGRNGQKFQQRKFLSRFR